MLAYNVVTWLLRVRLRSQPTWRELREALTRVLAPLPSDTAMEFAFATPG